MKNLAKTLEFPARQKPGGLTLRVLVLLPGRDGRDRGHRGHAHAHVQGTRGRTAVLARTPAGPPASLLAPMQPGEFGQLPQRPGRSDPPARLPAVGTGCRGSSAPPSPSTGPPLPPWGFPQGRGPSPSLPICCGEGAGANPAWVSQLLLCTHILGLPPHPRTPMAELPGPACLGDSSGTRPQTKEGWPHTEQGRWCRASVSPARGSAVGLRSSRNLQP